MVAVDELHRVEGSIVQDLTNFLDVLLFAHFLKDFLQDESGIQALTAVFDVFFLEDGGKYNLSLLEITVFQAGLQNSTAKLVEAVDFGLLSYALDDSIDRAPHVLARNIPHKHLQNEISILIVHHGIEVVVIDNGVVKGLEFWKGEFEL